MTVTIEYVKAAYYTTLKVMSGGTEVKIYMANAGQYSWLEPYYNQEVVVEVAACNWNDKNDQWRGCIIAVRNADGTKVFNPYNFDKY